MQNTSPPSARHHRSPAQQILTFFYFRPQGLLALLLAAPLLWFGVVYLGSLGALLIQSFFHLDDFTGQVVRQFTLQTYAELFTRSNVNIILRTVGMASSVTVAAAILAFPLAYYMARHTSSRLRAALSLAVLLPLWSNYLVRVYSWKLILAQEGILSWFIRFLHLEGLLNLLLSLPRIGGPSLSVSAFGPFLAFLYLWLPYMILPMQAALERVPLSLTEASADLGGRSWATFRWVILPLAFPGVVAGSIFTFSLTLGDFIVPSILGDSSLFIGQVAYIQQGTAGNIPIAAAFTVVPMAIMMVYLIAAKRLGAFDAL